MDLIFLYLKKYYFYVVLVSAGISAVSFGSFSSSLAGSLLAQTKKVGIAKKTTPIKRNRAKRRTFHNYSQLLSMNLLRDIAPEEEQGTRNETEENLSPTDLTLEGTIAGSCGYAVAVIKLKGEKFSKEYPCWARVGGYRIVSIGRGKIWLKDQNGNKVALTVQENVSKKKKGAKTNYRPTGKVHKRILSREEVKRFLKNPATIYKGAAFGPKMKGNKIVGYRIHRLKKGHFFYKLGARAGDVITRVNGHPFGNMDEMLKLWEEVKNATRVVVDLERKGKPLTYELIVKD